MNYKKYLEMICEGDITSVRAKEQAKQRGLTHQSHNIWKDKSDVEYKWNEQGKKFEKSEKKSSNDIKQILAKHYIWMETNGKKGERSKKLEKWLNSLTEHQKKMILK